MTSKCPKCKKDVEHEDYMFEVLCECGSRFNPFMDLSASSTPHEEPPAAAPDFQESQAAFAEIAQFAETGESTPSPVADFGTLDADPSSTELPDPALSTAAPAPRPRAVVDGNSPILTAGDTLPGYQIENYLAPISAASDLDSGSSNPLKGGFDALWAQALEQGANGVVAVRWVLSPDGTRVVMSGTPVICHPEPG